MSPICGLVLVVVGLVAQAHKSYAVETTPIAVSEGTVDATPMAVSEGTGTRSSSIPPTDQSTMEFATVTTPDEEEMSTGGGKTEDVNELDVIVAASKNWDLKNPATKENVPTPDEETLKRWGFYRIKSMGGLDDYRNEQYHKLMKELESRFELTAEHNQEMNMVLEAILFDDHWFQMFSHKVYRDLMEAWKVRAKRDADFDYDPNLNYLETPNPYYRP
ncbi:Hypothetical protein NTJ_16139 [Nesidiocoris tenuis]|uniref:Uncharacterized protein n=1 Tax=Nesidiocoris tenuis TaxID=355587 RepID=A0ABN7BHL9_9HEMI|nr:Hypothetical protein NTJ_16139 [Nesidiocoris tenuis]